MKPLESPNLTVKSLHVQPYDAWLMAPGSSPATPQATPSGAAEFAEGLPDARGRHDLVAGHVLGADVELTDGGCQGGMARWMGIE